MRNVFLIVAICMLMYVTAQGDTSSKRGLVYVYSEDTSDDKIWDASSQLSWYYNYGPSPTNGIDNDDLEFVPMLWGDDDGFYDIVKGLIDNGMNVNYVLGFNEPDGCEGGGSCVDAKKAAQIWQDEIEPLKKMGVNLGAPAVTGSGRGTEWLQDFFSHCGDSCTVDFLPVHWYGNFEGMASYIGGLHETYQNMTMWVTEFAEPDVSSEESQAFLNQSLGFLNELSYVDRYAYYGAFRSDDANDFVGPNVAMLDSDGDLTDVGTKYLGHISKEDLPNGTPVQATGFSGWVIMLIVAILFNAA